MRRFVNWLESGSDAAEITGALIMFVLGVATIIGLALM